MFESIKSFVGDLISPTYMIFGRNDFKEDTNN